MCERALDHNQKLLRFFPNCFVTTRILDNFDNDDLIAWYISTQRRELLSITLSVTLQCLLSFKYLFLYFLYKYSRFLHFHMIPAALLLIASYFSFKNNNFHCVLSSDFLKFFRTIFTSVYIKFIFHASKRRYCRNWKT